MDMRNYSWSRNFVKILRRANSLAYFNIVQTVAVIYLVNGGPFHAGFLAMGPSQSSIRPSKVRSALLSKRQILSSYRGRTNFLGA